MAQITTAEQFWELECKPALLARLAALDKYWLPQEVKDQLAAEIRRRSEWEEKDEQVG